MEAIRNYLETMFANLPNTPEVLRAKNELWQMMEDKYNELVADGKSDNEAVGTVIAEFGNLDEISEDLGIRNVVNSTQDITRRNVTMEEVKKYLHESSNYAYKISLGIFLCISSPIGAILSDEARFSSAFGLLFLMAFVAAAVVLFVHSSITIHRWDFLKHELCTIDFTTTNYVHDQKERYNSTYALLMTVGIVLCVISFVPAAIIDELDISFFGFDKDNMSGALLLLFVAIGVFMIVLSYNINNTYSNILKLNNASTVSGNYVSSQHPETKYISPAAATIMSVYWQTITCLYLIWSFLTFNWHYTWIIWPIAGIISGVLNSAFKKN